MKKCSELYLYPAQSSKTAARESKFRSQVEAEGGWVGRVWVVGCDWVWGWVGSVVLVRVRWWVGKVVGHEACEHELETRETVNLVTNGETRGA